MKLNLAIFASALAGASAFAPAAFSRQTTSLSAMGEPGAAPLAVAPFPIDAAKTSAEVLIQGNSLRTWAFKKPTSESEKIELSTDGRPLNAKVQLWIGPDWTPYDMKIYSEDGAERPVQTMIGTKGVANTIAVYNEAVMEFPLGASCTETEGDSALKIVDGKIADSMTAKKVEGGSVFTVPFPASVDRIQVLLNTNGMKLNARIELLNGPNNIKQTYELHTNDGKNRPFYAVFEAPGAGNVIRVVNLATLEFPFNAYICEA